MEIITPAALPAANEVLIGLGQVFSLSITSTGVLSFVSRHQSGAPSYEGASFVAGTIKPSLRQRILLVVDTDQENAIDAVRIYVNGRLATYNSRSHVQGAIMDFVGALPANFLNNSGGNQPFVGDFALLAIWPDEAIDWGNALNRSRVNADLFGDGSIFTGNRPAVLLKGDAATLNGNNTANEGTGNLIDNKGTDVA
jgi:hypothetical protein